MTLENEWLQLIYVPTGSFPGLLSALDFYWTTCRDTHLGAYRNLSRLQLLYCGREGREVPEPHSDLPWERISSLMLGLQSSAPTLTSPTHSGSSRTWYPTGFSYTSLYFPNFIWHWHSTTRHLCYIYLRNNSTKIKKEITKGEAGHPLQYYLFENVIMQIVVSFILPTLRLTHVSLIQSWLKAWVYNNSLSPTFS